MRQNVSSPLRTSCVLRSLPQRRKVLSQGKPIHDNVFEYVVLSLWHNVGKL